MNHAVLYLRDAQRTAAFYERVPGFARIIDEKRRQDALAHRVR